jgi:3-dehydroquinate synthetase
MDFNYLDTLPQIEMDSGMGEILKYSFLSKNIKTMVLKNAHIHEIICECASMKNRIVKEDPIENSIRIQLNLGHTFGHAIEKAYEIPHGSAVVMGIGLIHKIYPYSDFEKDYYELCSALGIDMGEKSYDYEYKKLKKYIEKDKKRVSDGEVELVLLKEVGKYYIEKVSLVDLEKGLAGVL